MPTSSRLRDASAPSRHSVDRDARLIQLAVALVALSIAAWLNWKWPVIRFRDYRADEVGLLILLLLPIPAAILLAIVLRRWTRALALAALMPLLVLNSCAAFLIVLDLPGDLRTPIDAAFEPVATADASDSQVVLYRTNCGATCAYGLEARQERVVVPGLLMIVRRLASWYPGEGGTVVHLADRRVRITTDGVRRDGRSGPSEFSLRPWVYF